MQLFFLFLILGFLNNEDEETIKKVNGICERKSVLRSLRIYRGEICTKKRFVVSIYNDMWERLKVSFYKLCVFV